VSPLPDWEQGTPAILCVAGPHAIPLSTAVRGGDDRILFALGRDRETLRRLREDARAAVCLLGEGIAFTATGRAAVLREELEAALAVERVQDHLADGRTEILDGARWRWTDERAREAEPLIVEELRALAGRR
jgi:Pyridoxamine 5'-phosphate oxidase